VSHPAPNDEIAGWLQQVRQRQFKQAQELLDALQPSWEHERPALIEGCRLLLQWYLRPIPSEYEEGLSGAVTGVSILRDEGYRPLIAWDMASVGYALGVLGDLETGIAWLDLALEDVRSTNDVRGQIYFLAHQGSLFTYAHEMASAEIAFKVALDLCNGPHAGLKAGILNNLSYWRILKAQQAGTPLPEQRTLAEEALREAREAHELMKANPVFAASECTALDNMAQASFLLEDFRQSEALFQEGLSKSGVNVSFHFALLVGYSELKMRQGQFDEARQTLQQATERQSPHRVGILKDRLLAAQIQLARLSGDEQTVQSLWEERLQWVQARYRERLRRVHEHAELQARLTRLQSQARATHVELKATELALLQARLQAEQSRQQERESVMLNLHDGLGSQLATARLRALWGELSQDDLVLLLDECMADLHLVVDTLGSNEGDLGRALRLLRNRTQNRLQGAGIETQWLLSVDDAPALSPVLLTNVLRVLQEALTNALKHAKARHITVFCDYQPSQATLLMQVIDDGQGISQEALTRMAADPGALDTAGKGLQNLRQRARRVGGDLQVRQRSPGTEIEFCLTLTGQAAP